MLEEERDKEFFCDYAGQALWIVSSMVAGLAESEAQLPQYIEMVHPELKPKKETAESIKQHVLARLTE